MSFKKNNYMVNFLLYTTVILIGLQTLLAFKSNDNPSPRVTEFSKSTTESLKDSKKNPSIFEADPILKKHWGLLKTEAPLVWENITKGSHDVVVAVIDTGIDTSHPDLNDNLWINPGEQGKDLKGRNKATNGLDDDGNGYVDDVHGWNFVDNNPNVNEDQGSENYIGHGTHISGIIGAERGNKVGISGGCPQVSLMTLKYHRPTLAPRKLIKNTVEAIKYATKNGAHIINYSTSGGPTYIQEEYKAIHEAQKKGVLFVAAAGNKHPNQRTYKNYPSGYLLPNIISVTATGSTELVLTSSNYNTNQSHVDLLAPGGNIISTLPKGTYGYKSGTSQASGFVSAAACLIKARFPSLKYAGIRELLLETGDLALPSVKSKSKDNMLAINSAKRLNIYKALTTLPTNITANGDVLKANHSSKTFAPNVKEEKTPSTIQSIGNSFLDALEQLSKSKKERKPASETKKTKK